MAAALALEAAQRGIKTLLVGLSVPDISLPTFLNLRNYPEPVSVGWQAPRFEAGIRPNVQTKGLLGRAGWVAGRHKRERIGQISR